MMPKHNCFVFYTVFTSGFIFEVQIKYTVQVLKEPKAGMITCTLTSFQVLLALFHLDNVYHIIK